MPFILTKPLTLLALVSEWYLNCHALPFLIFFLYIFIRAAGEMAMCNVLSTTHSDNIVKNDQLSVNSQFLSAHKDLF